MERYQFSMKTRLDERASSSSRLVRVRAANLRGAAVSSPCLMLSASVAVHTQNPPHTRPNPQIFNDFTPMKPATLQLPLRKRS
jgi:hypothetical protein